MVRFMIALAVGALFAIGATVLTNDVLSGVANGQPVTKTLYNYGTR